MPNYKKSEGLTDIPLTYCPGCAHGIIHKLIAETLVELEILKKAIIIAPVGCSVMAYDFFACDAIQAAHGRAPAVATGAKRSKPDSIVFCYQGDGDLGAIGAAEIIHAAHRSENITVIFVNNGIYGMTGGQMAPTTLIGQATTTSADGRKEKDAGEPLRISEILAAIPGASYVERVSVHNLPALRGAKRAIRRAFENQINGRGFSLVEALSTCPVGWKLSPVDALGYVKEKMLPYYPVGVLKDKENAIV